MENFNLNKQGTLANSSVLVPLIVFKLGSEEYAIKIEQVKEVTITPNITIMPKTPPFIRGVANIRGEIIAIMDLEQRFNITKKSEGQNHHKNTYTLVVERENYSVGLIVEEVPQTLTLFANQIEKTPNILTEHDINDRYIDGIGKVEGRLIIILDIHKILSVSEEQQLLERQG